MKQLFKFNFSEKTVQCLVCGETSPTYGNGVIEWEDRHRTKHKRVKRLREKREPEK